MSDRHLHDGATGATYKGFSTSPTVPGARAGETGRSSAWRRDAARAAVVAIAAMLLGAIAGGLAYKVRHGRESSVASISAPAMAPATAPAGLPPPPEAVAAQPAPPVARPLPERVRPAAPSMRRHAERRVAVRKAVAAPPVRAARGPAFHCERRLRPSERAICSDPTLSALDRRLNHAFGAAVRAGAPRASLRRTQDRWVFHREVVARRSHGALAAYYRQRIAELEALARRRR